MASGEWGVKDTTALIPVIQNVWAPYLTMRHVLLESFVWEEANRVPFLIREFSYDRDPSVRRQAQRGWGCQAGYDCLAGSWSASFPTVLVSAPNSHTSEWPT